MKTYIVIIHTILITNIFAQNEVCFDIEPNPTPNLSGFIHFTKYINVLDCFDIYAEASISDEKVLHAASVAAELLDNDEDGEVDDLYLKNTLAQHDAVMPLFASEWSQAANNFMNYYQGDGASAVLFNNEIDPNNPGHWGNDASVEEILHTINHVGHVNMHPNIFGLVPNSSIVSDAMDIARGGQFLNVPNNYPGEAWYHYDDWTCDYECMAIEYIYWCIVSNMGILDDPQTCNGIANEWEPCSPELFESTDLIMFDLIANNEYLIPQLAPDGNYCPEENITGDLNTDGIVNILDVINLVNIILGQTDFSELGDLNNDIEVDVLDIILLINIILGQEEQDSLPDECSLLPDPGMCFAAIPKYFYNQDTGLCEQFIWGGCGGVVPFDNIQDCMDACE